MPIRETATAWAIYPPTASERGTMSLAHVIE
jgi:hypothetical protein